MSPDVLTVWGPELSHHVYVFVMQSHVEGGRWYLISSSDLRLSHFRSKTDIRVTQFPDSPLFTTYEERITSVIFMTLSDVVTLSSWKKSSASKTNHRWRQCSSSEIMTVENMCNKSSSIPFRKIWISVRHRSSSSAESNIVLLTFRIFHRSMTWSHGDWWDVITFLWNRVTSAIENVQIIFIFFSMPSLSKNNLLRRSSFDESQVVRQLFLRDHLYYI